MRPLGSAQVVDTEAVGPAIDRIVTFLSFANKHLAVTDKRIAVQPPRLACLGDNEPVKPW